MFYVYLLRSLAYPKKTYIGFTTNIGKRLVDHNAGKSHYTSRYVPWMVVAHIGFESGKKARSFESYLKRHGGREFAQRHFW